MTWLSYTDDEVACFHPVFGTEGDSALATRALSGSYRWDHHPSDSVSGTPDFVLRDLVTGRWVVSVEIKRTLPAVWSPLSQLQAKGYAEANQHKFRLGWPCYFVITNLELTLLGALHGTRPPRECFVENGAYESARLGAVTESAHRDAICDAIGLLIDRVLGDQSPTFDEVWPAVLMAWVQHSSSFPQLTSLILPEPSTPGWEHVRDFFSGDAGESARRIFLLRCLASEYLRGMLSRHGHPRAASIPPMRPGRAAVASNLLAIQAVDFAAVFEAGCANTYGTLTDNTALHALDAFVSEITASGNRVANLAATRVDAPLLVESLVATITPLESQGDAGKIQTDPELAAVLATLAVHDPSNRIVDLGCGDGSLLLAAYDRLISLGATAPDVHAQLYGIEADPISIRVAAIRTSLKEPRLVDASKQATFVHGDLFAMTNLIEDADVILMNPPFKRYEAQDARPVPEALRAHYAEQISASSGAVISTQGQSNLYSFYVEQVTRHATDGAIAGFVLDNKWYHNRYAEALRDLLLDQFELLALVEYPHSSFFQSWMVSTSLLIARKATPPAADHEVRFLRSRADPRSTDLKGLSAAFTSDGPLPLDWTVRKKRQRELNAKDGWKRHFLAPLRHDFPSWNLVALATLFDRSRRGSLNKEGGGTQVFEFPFERTEYGPRREVSVGGGPYSTRPDSPLSDADNAQLKSLADLIPSEYRGYALKNSNGLSGYTLAETDVRRDETLEPPALRLAPELFRCQQRAAWAKEHGGALVEMAGQPETRAYIDAVESIVNLTSAVIADRYRWLVLREPYAGELVIPRKIRGGHRIHINPFALQPTGRQVRLSSNFITYAEVNAVDVSSGLDPSTSVHLIASFLLSAFGQLQLEMAGYNREGMLAVEKMHLDGIRVFDPRWIPPARRSGLVDALSALPYPIPPRPSASIPERVLLDGLWAQELATRFSCDAIELLDDVYDLLDEYLSAREP
jgi:predicted RNA methylase